MTDTTNALRALDYPGMADTLRRLASRRLLQKTEAQQLLDAANMLVKLGHAVDAALATARPDAAAVGKQEAGGLIELANRIRSHAVWVACDCGCESEKPADKASVAYIRAAALVRDYAAAHPKQGGGEEGEVRGMPTPFEMVEEQEANARRRAAARDSHTDKGSEG